MAFICPPQQDSQRRKDVLCQLKCAVDTLAKNEGPVPIHECPPHKSCCCCCCRPGPETIPDEEMICNPPDVMVCYKIIKSAKAGTKEPKSKKKDSDSKVKESKSRELRGGNLYIGCDCEKRNGLQDDCQRSECHGSPPCLTKPKPTCGPSQFSNGKHLMKKNTRGGAGKDADEAGADGSHNLGEYECYPAVIDTHHLCPCT